MQARNRALLAGTLAVVGLSLTVLGGCANPEGEYEAFKDRYEIINPPSTSSSVGGGCAVPAAGEADGDFFFALAPSIDPNSPLVFLATLTTADGSDGLDLNFSLQPLNADDRMTPVGSPLEFTTTADMTGSFMTTPADITTDGAANPFSDSMLVAENVTLSGGLCAPVDTACGTVDGDVTVPIPTPLTGSTFFMQRVTGPGDYPEPPQVNCAGDTANPL